MYLLIVYLIIVIDTIYYYSYLFIAPHTYSASRSNSGGWGLSGEVTSCVGGGSVRGGELDADSIITHAILLFVGVDLRLRRTFSGGVIIMICEVGCSMFYMSFSKPNLSNNIASI